MEPYKIKALSEFVFALLAVIAATGGAFVASSNGADLNATVLVSAIMAGVSRSIGALIQNLIASLTQSNG